MSRTISRVAGGVLAVLTAAAVGDVAIARAQATTSIIVSTSCGAGTIEKCGDKPIESCDTEYVLEFDPVTRSFRIVAKRTNCKVIGSTPIYKNKYGQCSATGGSTGTGLVGMRGSGDEQAIEEDGGTCE